MIEDFFKLFTIIKRYPYKTQSVGGNGDNTATQQSDP